MAESAEFVNKVELRLINERKDIMRSIACAIISFVCWYVVVHLRKESCEVLRGALVLTGFGMLIASIILMAFGM